MGKRRDIASGIVAIRKFFSGGDDDQRTALHPVQKFVLSTELFGSEIEGVEVDTIEWKGGD